MASILKLVVEFQQRMEKHVKSSQCRVDTTVNDVFDQRSVSLAQSVRDLVEMKLAGIQSTSPVGSTTGATSADIVVAVMCAIEKLGQSMERAFDAVRHTLQNDQAQLTSDSPAASTATPPAALTAAPPAAFQLGPAATGVTCPRPHRQMLPFRLCRPKTQRLASNRGLRIFSPTRSLSHGPGLLPTATFTSDSTLCKPRSAKQGLQMLSSKSACCLSSCRNASAALRRSSTKSRIIVIHLHSQLSIIMHTS